MSRSYRQIGVPKQLPRDPSSLSTYTHRRTGSIQNRNFSQLVQLGRKYYDRNQMHQATEVLGRGLYYDPSNIEVNFMLGVAHMSLEHYADSLKYLNQVFRTNKKYKKELIMMLAIAHRKLGDLAQSLKTVDIALDQEQTIQALLFRAKLNMKMKKYDSAVADFDRVLQSNDKHTLALTLKVKSLMSQKSYQKALQTIKQAKSRLDDAEVLQQLSVEQSRILLDKQDYQSAFQLFQKIQSQFSNVAPQTYLTKAKLYKKIGKTQEAMMIYNQLLGKNCSSKVFSEAIAEAAISCMRERDFYEALAYLKRSQMTNIRSKPTDQLMRLAQGVTFLMKKKYAEAIVLMGSCQLNFSYELQVQMLFLNNLLNNAFAFGNFSLGNHEQALELYQKIQSQQNTDMTAASYNICICEGIIAYSKGNKEESLNLFEKAASFILRPEPFFYMAVIMNQDYLKQPINTQGFVRILQLIERGLRAGQNAHMYYYRAILYLYLGMNNQALEDIDRAIQKSQDNVAKYFHARGVIFFLDKNYEQAIMEFGTALSIDQNDNSSLLQKAKCELLQGQEEAAYTTLEGVDKSEEWVLLFLLYQKQYSRVLQSSPNENIKQICNFMEGKFEQAGPSGKLMLAILYQNYQEVVGLIDQAVGLSVSIGCLQVNDLLILKGFCEYRLGRYQEALLSLGRVQSYLKQTSARSETYSEEDQRKLLQCRVNIILLNFQRQHQLQALSLAEQLISEVCEGPIFDEINQLKIFLAEGGQHQVELAFNSPMLSDYFAHEQHKGLKFKYLLPQPNYKVLEVQYPHYQQLLTTFTSKDIQNRPQAPWIKRGQFGLIFTNEVRQYQNLNLKTEQNEGVRSRMPTHQQSRALSKKKSQLIQQLKLSTSVLNKLERIAQKKEKE